MSKPGILYCLREWLTTIAFAVYLRCAGMTKDEFWAEQDRQALQQVLEADGVGELLRAGEELLKFRAKLMLIIAPYQEEMQGLDHALAHLSTAVHRTRLGSAPAIPTSESK